ncbi:MAG: MarR family transcriptional regulator [Bacteroidia bacterium]|nr:MarR family transcriptional regulator [Bacteroidia bacterium]MDW8158721.1 MarR family transcriptional regulator [Bacteroidia bacterium]
MEFSDFDLNYQNTNIESKIVAALERIAEVFRVILWGASKKSKLSPIQIQILVFLLFHSNNQKKVSYLAQEFNMTKATISEALKKLEEKNLVYREPSIEDARSFVVNLTSTGKKIAQEMSLFTQQINEVVNKLSKQEKENLLLTLLKIIKSLNELGVISIQRMCMNCIHYEFMPNSNTHFCHLLNHELATHELRIECPDFNYQKN